MSDSGNLLTAPHVDGSGRLKEQDGGPIARGRLDRPRVAAIPLYPMAASELAFLVDAF
jgi:hypothetical protein